MANVTISLPSPAASIRPSKAGVAKRGGGATTVSNAGLLSMGDWSEGMTGGFAVSMKGGDAVCIVSMPVVDATLPAGSTTLATMPYLFPAISRKGTPQQGTTTNKSRCQCPVWAGTTV